MSRGNPVDANTPGAVARYRIRPPITPERMLGGASSAQVIYRSDAVHLRHQANFRVFDPLDFSTEVTAHIPDVHEKTTLFYGWYSNRTRGYRKWHGLLANAQAADPVPGRDDGAPPEVRRSWARWVFAFVKQPRDLLARLGGALKPGGVLVVHEYFDYSPGVWRRGRRKLKSLWGR